MTRNILCFLGILILVSSCVNNNPPRTELEFNKVIVNNLFTRFPGTLRVTSNHILLQNPFNKDAFLQMYDRLTGEEVLNAGTLGKGPGEWNNPDISNVINDRVAIYDAYLKQVTFITVNTMLNISNPDLAQKIDTDISKFVFFDDSQYIVANWKETQPFEFFSNGELFPCGQYPIKEIVKNTADSFQGNIQVHSQKGLLVYATFDNPYIALYQIKKNELMLIWENQFKPPQYSIAEGQLRWGKEQPDGVSDIAFTKDYIVCLVKDFKSETNGRDVRTAPKAIYVFDYDGQLIQIFDLPVHSVRLASDAETNIFYSVALEPDYRIIEYNLSLKGL